MDALGIEQAVLAGADWGARTVGIVAALWPERCSGLVSVSGYLIGSQRAGELPLAPEAEREWWYQYYFATERGRPGYERYRREFARLIWQTPRRSGTSMTPRSSAGPPSLDNPTHVAIVIHNYRWRIGLSDGEPQYDALGAASPPRPSSACDLPGPRGAVARAGGHLEFAIDPAKLHDVFAADVGAAGRGECRETSWPASPRPPKPPTVSGCQGSHRRTNRRRSRRSSVLFQSGRPPMLPRPTGRSAAAAVPDAVDRQPLA